MTLKTKALRVDSLKNHLQKLDSLAFHTPDTASSKSIKSTNHTLEFISQKGAYISVEQDTSGNKAIPIQKTSQASSGVLKVELITDLTDFRFQLIGSNDNVAYEKRNQKEMVFNTVKAAKYRIRVLIDTNKDGKWSYGNLLNNEEPEEVFLYNEEISIRENWEVKLDITI